jgi:hypothetical protein
MISMQAGRVLPNLGHRTFVLLLALASSSACQMVDCTLIGCDSGLQVLLTGNFPVGARITAAAPGEPLRTVDCPATGPCARAFFPNFTSNRVSITIASSSGVTSRDFTLTYKVFQPNGRDCGPTCSIAEVTFPL